MFAATDDAAIRNLVARYADSVHHRDFATWEACWTEDCRWELGARGVVEGRAAASDLVQRVMATFTDIYQVTYAGCVEFEDDTHARGLWWLHETNRDADGVVRQITGRYEDRYVKEDAGWKFAARSFRMISRMVVTGDVEFAPTSVTTQA